MSNYGGGYNQYGGNPYGQTGGESGYDAGNRTEAGYPQANPYSNQGQQQGGYGGASNRYDDQPQQQQPPTSNYGQSNPQYGQQAPTSQYGQQAPTSQPAQEAPTSQPLSRDEFLQRVEATKTRINDLTTNIGQIGAAHQSVMSNPDPSASARLEALVTRTQLLNTGIKNEIKNLERDAARSSGNTVKNSQIKNLKQNFQTQLKDYQRQESDYRQRYRDGVKRQFLIVNPTASPEEIAQAQEANWEGEGVFQTALKSNRTGEATSILGNVRARHNDILQIEKTMVELAELFQQLDEQVVYQENMVQQIEQQTEQVKGDTQAANVHLDKGIKSARNRRKLKWWCTGIIVLILAAVALGLGIYFGVVVPRNNKNAAAPAPPPQTTQQARLKMA